MKKNDMHSQLTRTTHPTNRIDRICHQKVTLAETEPLEHIGEDVPSDVLDIEK